MRGGLSPFHPRKKKWREGEDEGEEGDYCGWSGVVLE